MGSVIGQNPPRVDGWEKVSGRAVYTGDIRLPGMAFGKVLRSPLPHARIRRIDSRAAESVPGVLAVLTRENLQVAFPYHGAYVKDQPIIAPNLIDYRLPRFPDLPRSFHTHILEEGGGPGPYGAKGMGEGGILAVAPAVCNAVYNATGIRLTRVPLMSEAVWKALQRDQGLKE